MSMFACLYVEKNAQKFYDRSTYGSGGADNDNKGFPAALNLGLRSHDGIDFIGKLFITITVIFLDFGKTSRITFFMTLDGIIKPVKSSLNRIQFTFNTSQGMTGINIDIILFFNRLTASHVYFPWFSFFI